MVSNPFQSPPEEANPAAVDPKLKRHAASIRALGVLWLLFGVIALAIGISIGMSLMSVLTTTIGVFFLVSGFGAIKRTRWGYVLSLILCSLLLLQGILSFVINILNSSGISSYQVGANIGSVTYVLLGGFGLKALINGRELFAKKATT